MAAKAQSQGILPVQIDNIPMVLKIIRQWVAWRARPEVDGKVTKIPVNPGKGINANPTDPATWGTFEEAEAYYRRAHQDDCIGGIGFVFTKEDPYCGVDLDDCRNPASGEIQDWATEILKQLNSYSEVSPSGTGVKVFLKGKLPSHGRKFGNIEMYDTARYFTMTGVLLNGFPVTVEDRPQEISDLYKRLDAKPDKSEPKGVVVSNAGMNVDVLLVPLGTRKLILEGEIPGKRSEAMMSVLGSLVKAGVPDGTIFGIFETYPIGEKYREKGASREKWLRTQIDKAKGFVKPPEASTVFPYHVMSGAAGHFAGVYSEVLESPSEFFYLGFLTGLGVLLADKLTLASELRAQPRLYTLLLGQSADDRKSTALDKVVEFFQGWSDRFQVNRGVGSAEGLQKKLDKLEKNAGGLLIVLDEFSQFMSKANIEGSVLVEMVNTLYESNDYENQTKHSEIVLRNAYLSMFAASTIDTYDNSFKSKHFDLGFVNRIFIVPGTAKRRIAIPRRVSSEDIRELRAQVDKIIEHAGKHPEMALSQEAQSLYEDWYAEKERSVHARRLDTIALRLMVLLAANDLKEGVDEETVRRVLELADWQLKVRKQYDPIDADNKIAGMEQKIKRFLGTGPKTERELKQRANANRDGLWKFEQALNNLKRAKEIARGQSDRWSLVG
jgi:hypothetical protein